MILAKIHVFRDLDWPSSISGWQVMAKKTNPLGGIYQVMSVFSC